MAIAQETVPEVRVTGLSTSSYIPQTSSSATKTDTLLRDVPQSITVITKELIQDQGMQSIADAIRYVPGIVTSQGEGNRDAAIFRGNSSTSDFYIDGIRDDVQYYRDFYNIESVEALKGANAMIFGRGGSGGVINRVSKVPEWHHIGQAAVTFGSWSNRRATIDVGDAISQTTTQAFLSHRNPIQLLHRIVKKHQHPAAQPYCNFAIQPSLNEKHRHLQLHRLLLLS